MYVCKVRHDKSIGPCNPDSHRLILAQGDGPEFLALPVHHQIVKWFSFGPPYCREWHSLKFSIFDKMEKELLSTTVPENVYRPRQANFGSSVSLRRTIVLTAPTNEFVGFYPSASIEALMEYRDSPSRSMFCAAFSSLSWCEPHSGQTQSRTDRFLTRTFL